MSTKSEDPRRFLVVWGKGFEHLAEEYAEHRLSHFKKANGFDEDDQDQIDQLDVGESYVVFNTFSVIRSVVRLRDGSNEPTTKVSEDSNAL